MGIKLWLELLDNDHKEDTYFEISGASAGELAADIRNLLTRTKWQPIETAPQRPANFKWEEKLPSFLVWDGKDIYCVEAGLYAKDNGCGCCSSEIEATHWMPLPEPPKQEAK